MPSTEKLSRAQVAVLERMATGDEVWTTPHPGARTFWQNGPAKRAPSFATLHALWTRGCVQDLSPRPSQGHQYSITPAGRKALAEAGERNA